MSNRKFHGITDFNEPSGRGIQSNGHAIVPLFKHDISIRDDNTDEAFTLNFVSSIHQPITSLSTIYYYFDKFIFQGGKYMVSSRSTLAIVFVEAYDSSETLRCYYVNYSGQVTSMIISGTITTIDIVTEFD